MYEYLMNYCKPKYILIVFLSAGRDARLASARALAMSSVGYGFALPCLQLLSALTRRRVAGALLLAAAVVFLINGYRLGWYHKEIKVMVGMYQYM